MQRELCGEKERAHPAHDDGQRVARCWDDEQQVSNLYLHRKDQRLKLGCNRKRFGSTKIAFTFVFYFERIWHDVMSNWNPHF